MSRRTRSLEILSTTGGQCRPKRSFIITAMTAAVPFATREVGQRLNAICPARRQYNPGPGTGGQPGEGPARIGIGYVNRALDPRLGARYHGHGASGYRGGDEVFTQQTLGRTGFFHFGNHRRLTGCDFGAQRAFKTPGEHAALRIGTHDFQGRFARTLRHLFVFGLDDLLQDVAG